MCCQTAGCDNTESFEGFISDADRAGPIAEFKQTNHRLLKTPLFCPRGFGQMLGLGKAVCLAVIIGLCANRLVGNTRNDQKFSQEVGFSLLSAINSGQKTSRLEPFLIVSKSY